MHNALSRIGQRWPGGLVRNILFLVVVLAITGCGLSINSGAKVRKDGWTTSRIEDANETCIAEMNLDMSLTAAAAACDCWIEDISYKYSYSELLTSSLAQDDSDDIKASCKFSYDD